MKLFFLIGLGIGMLVFSIVAGVIGKRGATEDCDCIKASDAGWRGFSIAWFILTIIAIPVMLKFGLMCSENLLKSNAAAYDYV